MSPQMDIWQFKCFQWNEWIASWKNIHSFYLPNVYDCEDRFLMLVTNTFFLCYRYRRLFICEETVTNLSK